MLHGLIYHCFTCKDVRSLFSFRLFWGVFFKR
ncbi:hypothetical protein F383_10143 [Gossypium arboreum]|uniref:Uncharacterized protein n=1 Tax=Gossypium arboreum TaxID=29729 RepID=A0A0B0PZI3_GOSAR|nr:hypothetical protein F383_10143 [Gossypium arboreum]